MAETLGDRGSKNSIGCLGMGPGREEGRGEGGGGGSPVQTQDADAMLQYTLPPQAPSSHVPPSFPLHYKKRPL
eukprot:212384-Pyramimonas_sp.AAC.1